MDYALCAQLRTSTGRGNELKLEERELHAPYHAIASSRRRLATLTTGGDCHASSDSRYFDFGVGYELVWCCVRARSWRRRRWGRHCWWSGSRPRWNRDEYSQQERGDRLARARIGVNH